MKTKKTLILILAVALVMSLVAGCGGAPTTPADKPTTTDTAATSAAPETASGESASQGSTEDLPVFKIGFLCDMTGGSSWYGGIMNTLGRAVIDQINQEGIEGFSKIEVTTYDVASDQNVAIEQVTRAALEDGMNVVWGSWVEAQLIPFTNEFASIPYVMSNTTGYKVLSSDAGWVIVPSACSWDYGIVTGKFFIDNDVKTWAITGQGWGEGWLDAWAEGVKYTTKDTDIQCVYDVECPSDQVDWSAVIAEWKKLNPEAVVIPNPGSGAFSIIQQMKDSGFWPKYVIFDPMAGGDYSVVDDSLGLDYMKGMYSVTAADLDSQAWLDFAKLSVSQGYMPYGFSAELVDGLRLIAKAAEDVGNVDYKDPAKMMEALRSAKITDGALGGGGLGPFRENGLQEKCTASIVKCVAGAPSWTDQKDYHWETVYTAEISPQMGLEEAVAVWPDLGTRLGVN